MMKSRRLAGSAVGTPVTVLSMGAIVLFHHLLGGGLGSSANPRCPGLLVSLCLNHWISIDPHVLLKYLSCITITKFALDLCLGTAAITMQSVLGIEGSYTLRSTRYCGRTKPVPILSCLTQARMT